jgi:NADH-ubiquinone oxidoreductase chain 6
MYNFLLDLLSLGAILSGVLVITNKNPVISVIFLISLFINAAGYLIILGLGFVGIAYILIYIGAITVLFLFVIMMINIKLVDILETGSDYTKNLPLALAVGGLFLYEIFSILPLNLNNISILSLPIEFLNYLNGLLLLNESTVQPLTIVNSTINPFSADTNFTSFLHIETLGQGIFTYGATWLIVLSFILLLSLVAPIVLSKNNRTE